MECPVYYNLTNYNKEDYGGEWDLKTSWALKSDVVYLYRGMRLNKNDIGNIHYGYVGSSCFYSDMLLRAAGLAQFLLSDFEGSNWQTFFDEPRDQEAIKYGITLWEEGLV